MSLWDRSRLVRLTRPLSACAPSAPMSLPPKSRLVVASQVEAGEVDQTLERPRPLGPDGVAR
jgi:hypothetical protein